MEGCDSALDGAEITPEKPSFWQKVRNAVTSKYAVLTLAGTAASSVVGNEMANVATERHPVFQQPLS